MLFEYKDVSIKSVWDDMDKDKASVVTRAMDCAKLTIPSVFPADGFNDENTLDDVYQSFGARAVLNLSSKFMQTLFPTTQSFFKLMPTKQLEEQIVSGGNKQALDELNTELVKLETAIQNEAERQQLRRPLHEALKLVIVTGNALLWKDEEGVTVFSLRDYVVKRDYKGNLLDVIVREKVSPKMLPPDSQFDTQEEEIDVFSRLVFDGENYQFYQEINEEIVAGSEKSYKKTDTLPFLVLRWTAIPNTNYGRGLVEHYIGDLRSYEALNIVILDTASVMARTLFLVNPNSKYGTNVQQLNDAVTGDYIAGHAEDITVPQVNKNSDLATIINYMQMLEQRLSQAFLLYTTRNAERVTAEEIREVSQQLEETLGGVYTLLADDLQKPLLASIMKDLKIKLDGQVEAVVTSGLDALGRNADMNKLVIFMNMVSQLPNALGYLDIHTLVQRMAYSTGVKTDGLVKSKEEIQQEQAQQQQQMQDEQITQAGLNGLTKAVPELMKQGGLPNGNE